MAKYDPLEHYLSAHAESGCMLTFAEIEGIIGAPLPPSARTHRRWWGNDRTHVQARSWLDTSREVTDLWLEEERVLFERVYYDPPPADDSPKRPRSQVIVRNLDTEIVAALKQKARRNGHSLEQELRVILTRAAGPERSTLIAEADRIRAMTAGPLEDSVALLRRDRDSR